MILCGTKNGSSMASLWRTFWSTFIFRSVHVESTSTVVLDAGVLVFPGFLTNLTNKFRLVEPASSEKPHCYSELNETKDDSYT